MPVRRPLVRLLRWSGMLCAGVLVVVGGLGLHGPGLVAVGVAGLLAACTAAGITRDDPRRDRRAVLETALQAAAWTVGVLLALAGAATLAGGLVALLVGAVAVAAWLLTRVPWWGGSTGRPAAAAAGPSWPTGVEVLLLPVPLEDGPRPAAAGSASSSVSGLTTPALGREWLRTTAALAARPSPAERQALVRRREETLDELERRDPAGFGRWLADGPVPGSDPAAYVHGRPVQDDPTAGTDAA